MSRTNEEIEQHIKNVLEEHVDPVVAEHGGEVNFSSYSDGVVLLEMSGACSGCAGSTMTLKAGIEGILQELVPEVESVEGFDDPLSTVNPFYSYDHWSFHDGFDESIIPIRQDNDSNS